MDKLKRIFSAPTAIVNSIKNAPHLMLLSGFYILVSILLYASGDKDGGRQWATWGVTAMIIQIAVFEIKSAIFRLGADVFQSLALQRMNEMERKLQSEFQKKLDDHDSSDS